MAMAVKEHDLVFEKDVNIASWEYHVGCDCVTYDHSILSIFNIKVDSTSLKELTINIG